jgi:hypothetical protein
MLRLMERSVRFYALNFLQHPKDRLHVAHSTKIPGITKQTGETQRHFRTYGTPFSQ